MLSMQQQTDVGSLQDVAVLQPGALQREPCCVHGCGWVAVGLPAALLAAEGVVGAGPACTAPV